MKIGQTPLEHQADIISSMSDVLAKRFFRYAKLNDEIESTDVLTDLSKSIGYLTVVSNSVEKTFKQEKRLKRIEDQMKDLPLNMQMFNKPEEMQVKYR